MHIHVAEQQLPYTANLAKQLSLLMFIQSSSRHITGQLGNEFFQAINCTGTDNQTRYNQEKYTKN